MHQPSFCSLYTKRAIECDADYSKALKDAGMDRWTTNESDYTPAVKAAFDAKLRADEHMHQAWTLWRS